MDSPRTISPMLVCATREPFDSPAYWHEPKWDGIRAIGFAGPRPRIHSRRLRFIESQFPEVCAELEALPDGTIIDGELVVFEGGRPVFERVRQRLATHHPRRVAQQAVRHPATFIGFDLLSHRGDPILWLPLEERRRRLLTLPTCEAFAAPGHFDSGTSLYEAVLSQGLEGIVSKRRDSRYLPGKRSRAWLKCKPPGYDRYRFRRR